MVQFTKKYYEVMNLIFRYNIVYELNLLFSTGVYTLVQIMKFNGFKCIAVVNLK